jgi:CheY-like chemotaxis protein
LPSIAAGGGRVIMMMKILVIDDEPAVAVAIQNVLRTASVLREADAVSAVATFASAAALRQPFELVVCKVEMRGMNGYDVLAAVLAHRSSPPVVLIASEPVDPERALRATCVLYQPLVLADVQVMLANVHQTQIDGETLRYPRARTLTARQRMGSSRPARPGP